MAIFPNRKQIKKEIDEGLKDMEEGRALTEVERRILESRQFLKNQKEQQYKARRLEIAAKFVSGCFARRGVNESDLIDSLMAAEKLIKLNEERPLP